MSTYIAQPPHPNDGAHALLVKPKDARRQHLRVARYAMGGVSTTPILDHLRQQAYESEFEAHNRQAAAYAEAFKAQPMTRKTHGRVRSRP